MSRNRMRYLVRRLFLSAITASAFLAIPMTVSAQADLDPRESEQLDQELIRRINSILPALKSAIRGESVDAQRSALAVIEGIPVELTSRLQLTGDLTGLIERTKDPEIKASAMRSFARSMPNVDALPLVLGPAAKSNDPVVRRGAVEAASIAVRIAALRAKPGAIGRPLPVFKDEKIEPRQSTYGTLSGVAQATEPILSAAVGDADATTRQHAFDGTRSIGKALVSAFYVSSVLSKEDLRLTESFADKLGKLAPAIQAMSATVKSAATSKTATEAEKLPLFESAAVVRGLILTNLQPTDSKKTALDDCLKQVIPGVAQIVGSGNSDHRRLALNVLEPIGGGLGDFATAVNGTTGDADPFIRWSAARVLGRLADPSASASERSTAVRGLEVLARDRSVDVRMAALTALQKFGKDAGAVSATLVQAAGKGDAEARTAAIRAAVAAELDASAMLPTLIAGLADEDIRLQRASAAALGRLGAGARPALDQLRIALKSDDSDLRISAAEAILAIENAASPAKPKN